MTQREKSLAVMLSKRSNVFYLEHVKVIQKDHRVVYLSEDQKSNFGQFFNIPEKNTVFLLLGKGSSITDAAARLLAESNVVVGFCGSGGSPFFSAIDLCFLTPASEYRPTEYAQAWMKMWMSDESRLEVAKSFLAERVNWVKDEWSQNEDLLKKKLVLPNDLFDNFSNRVAHDTSAQKLLLTEAYWAKNLYKLLAQTFRFEFTRQEGAGLKETYADQANSFLDHGNYIAYGYAASMLNCLGIPYALPVLHGKTRRGALVFDIADLFKDAIVMPLAFSCAASKESDQEFRLTLIRKCQESQILDRIFDFVKFICEKYK